MSLVAIPLAILTLGCAALAGTITAGWALRSSLALLLGTAHFILAAYYVLAFVSWAAWNQLVTVELILGYIKNLPDLVAALPFSIEIQLAAVLVPLLAFYGAYFAAAPALCHSLQDATQALARLSRKWQAACAFISIGAVSLGGSELGGALHRLAPLGEPIALTLLSKGTPLGSMRLHLSDPVNLHLDRKIASEYRPSPQIRKMHVVIITVDALRADHMQVYGYGRETTPFLSRLVGAGRMERFDPAYSVCTDSFCGLMAILASKYWYKVSYKNFALTDVLKRHGYEVYFLLSGDHGRYYGLRDFYGEAIDSYRDGASTPGYVNDDRKVLDYLQSMTPAGQTPRFLFIHLMSAHLLGKRLPEYEFWEPSRIIPSADGVSEELRRRYTNRYNNGIRQVDAVIEGIFSLLAQKNMLQNALVAITADHGEFLGEHGRLLHAEYYPFEPLVRIPLLVYDSDRFRYPRWTFAVQVDIAPTMLDRIGAPIPEHWAGKPLNRPGERRFSVLQSGENYGVLGEFGGELFKYLQSDAGGQPRLFNLSRDPGESRGLSPEAHQPVVEAMRAHLKKQVPARARE